MNLFTIGFTKKTAQEFFELLIRSGAKRIVDVRLNNVSQLSGFAKKDDLKFFLAKICGLEYVPVKDLAPTREILDAYRKKRLDWEEYQVKFLDLMRKRKIETEVSRQIISDGCLLCSEHEPHHCHRRLVAEYLKRHWGDIDIVHL